MAISPAAPIREDSRNHRVIVESTPDPSLYLLDRTLVQAPLRLHPNGAPVKYALRLLYYRPFFSASFKKELIIRPPAFFILLA